MQQKKEGEFELNWWGVIDKIEENECEARIYNVKDNELVDVITFDKKEFSQEDQSRINLNVVFLWTLACKDNQYSSVFKLKEKRDLTEEEKERKKTEIHETLEFMKSIV